MTGGRGPVLAIYGPTGTGKTALAVRLADLLRVQLVSCDAVQVYRDLRAAAAKPEGAEWRHPWALVDAVEPTRDVDMGWWVRSAEAECRWAWRAGRLPVVAGGTGMYLRGLLKGLAPAPPRDEALRARLRRLADRHSVPWLHRVLVRLDPASASRVRPRDEKRIVRALEVRLSTGRSLAELQGEAWRGPDRFPVFRVMLDMPREELYARLDRRVEGFFARGLVAEVRWLLGARGVPPTANALKGIGYREVVASLRGEAPEDGLTLVERVQRSTRRYAKRQWTWFRGEPTDLVLDARRPVDELAREVVALLRDRWRGILNLP